MPTALITGPTSGIGNVFARRLAQTGWDLVLVARDSERLERVADDLRAAHGRQIEVLPADLAEAGARARVAARLAEAERPVDLLVNNAGYAVGHRFLDHEFGAEDESLAVLVRAVMQLSHAAGNAMRERGHGAIINVSSVAGFLPRGSYAAAKAWVTSFSRSLAGELAGSGVRVVATCPGFTRTEFHARGGFNTDEIPDFLWLSAEHVVDDALEALRRGKVVTIPGLQWKAIVAAARYLPVGAIGMATRQIGRRAPAATSDHSAT
ncbi:MAG: SDR family NAD(P)-dependent oxidoreductase [Sporichthyaceae bacterium]